MSEKYENETTEIGEELKECIFVLDENGRSVLLDVQDDTEDTSHA